MLTTKVREVFGSLIILFLLSAPSVQAAEPQQPATQGPSDEELVKPTQNLVADLTSVPMQNNFNAPERFRHFRRVDAKFLSAKHLFVLCENFT